MSCDPTITLVQWDTLIFSVFVKAWWIPMDLFWSQVLFTIKQYFTDPQPILSKICTLIDTQNGEVWVNVSSTEMNIPAWTYKWELQITDSQWTVSTTPTQTLKITPQLTI